MTDAPVKRRYIYQMIREEVERAVTNQKAAGEFRLSGRGHEARVTLDRRLAVILRDCSIPRIHIAGFGANFFYPWRVLQEASVPPAVSGTPN